MSRRRGEAPEILPWKVRGTGLVVESDSDSGGANVLRYPPEGNEDRLICQIHRATKRTAIRFAVGRPGECSSVFRVWANRDKFDVYAAIRTWKDLAKFSFHESGVFVFHLSSVEHVGAKWVSRPDSGNRRIESWDRPEPFVPGWTHLITFMVPTVDVYRVDSAGWDDPAKVRWIPRPKLSNTVTELRVVVGDPNMPLIDVGPSDYLLDAGLVDGFVLVNGQVVLLTMHVTKLDEVGRKRLRQLRRNLARDSPDDFDPATELGARFACGNTLLDGRRALWDLAPPR